MRISLPLKILSGYVVTASFLAVVTGVGVLSLKDISAKFDESTIQRLDQIVAARSLQAHAEALERASRMLGDKASAESLELWEFHKKQADRSLVHLAVLAGEDPAIQDVSRLFSAALEQAGRYSGGALTGTGPGSFGDPGFASLINRLEAFVSESSLGFKSRLRSANSNGRGDSSLIGLLGALGIVTGGCLAAAVVFYVLDALKKLQASTHFIGEGSFDVELPVSSQDEIGDLASDLAVMGQKLKNYEEQCLDASPLTRLPGNIAIERALLDRMRRGEKFALCYADLDYFKAYNDRYGYARGSEVIKAIAELLFQAKQSHARPGDFVGHIGGDDFVLITSPDLVDAVCKHIISEFDRVIPEFYDQEDREKGYIEGTDRYGVKRQFPLLTISVAVVSDAQRNIQSPTEIAQVAAEIKDFVKTMPGSNYLIDRRRNPR